jgi:hypothetical protein
MHAVLLRRIIPIHITPRNIVIPISIVGSIFEAINNIYENLLPQSLNKKYVAISRG